MNHGSQAAQDAREAQEQLPETVNALDSAMTKLEASASGGKAAMLSRAEAEALREALLDKPPQPG